jgi:hypothetical protein
VVQGSGGGNYQLPLEGWVREGVSYPHVLGPGAVPLENFLKFQMRVGEFLAHVFNTKFNMLTHLFMHRLVVCLSMQSNAVIKFIK